MFYICNALRQKDMKNTTTLRDKVIAKLIKWGNNSENAQSMVNDHFKYVESKYTGVSKIAEVIGYL